MEKFYKVSESELRKLYEAKECYNALQRGGVDNWEWYSDAISQYLEDNKAEDFDQLVELDLAQLED